MASNGTVRSTSVARDRTRFVVCALSLIALLTVVAAPIGHAQTFEVLHNFTGGGDGDSPQTGLSIDGRGNLYGTTNAGGSGFGTVYQLVRGGSAYTLNPLYQFAGGRDGGTPTSRVVFGPDGALYGTALRGDPGCQGFDGCGVVYRLTPPPTFCRSVLCPWRERLAFAFTDYVAQGAGPSGDLVFDQAGNMYGTTTFGGSNVCGDGLGCGTVFQLVPSGGTWTENVLYRFTVDPISYPSYGVVFDSAGNLYGTANPYCCTYESVVFQLENTRSGWIANTLYGFTGHGNGYDIMGGIVLDASGNVIGGTVLGGPSNFGVIYKLNPVGSGWNFNLIYNFVRAVGGPKAGLTMDSAGNLYGTAYGDGAHSLGSVFELSPSLGGWIYTDLHDFNLADEKNPASTVLIGPDGSLYGTASGGGTGGHGVVWKITP
jgi:uncharacterized repeat protein (TIGR03803 family)